MNIFKLKNLKKNKESKKKINSKIQILNQNYNVLKKILNTLILEKNSTVAGIEDKSKTIMTLIPE